MLLKQLKCVFTDDVDLYDIGKVYYFSKETDTKYKIIFDDDKEKDINKEHFVITGTSYMVYEETAPVSHFNGHHNHGHNAFDHYSGLPVHKQTELRLAEEYYGSAEEWCGYGI